MGKAETNENLKDILKEQRDEYQRYVGAAFEHFQSQTEAIAEQYGNISKKLDDHGEKLDSHTEMIGSIKIDVEIIKGNIELIKNSLKKKVDVDEFSFLEKRVALLERHQRLSIS